MKPLVTVFALGLAGIATASSARADCPDGIRLLSEREREAYRSMGEAIKASIPAAPGGLDAEGSLRQTLRGRAEGRV